MTEYKVLGKSELLAVEDRRYEEILVPEWKGKIRIQSLSASEGLDLMAALQNDEANQGMILCLIKSAVDVDGALLFEEDNVEVALHQLKEKALSGFSIVQNNVLRLNRLGNYSDDEVVDEAKKD